MSITPAATRFAVKPVALLFAALSVACTLDGVGAAAPEGALFRIDVSGSSDVVGFHFEIDRTACDGEAIEPMAIATDVEIVAVDDGHLVADVFIPLEAGCWVVAATPAGSMSGPDWTPSADCAAAPAQSVEIEAGRHATVYLFSQCLADEYYGSLGGTVSLNHPPEVTLDIDLVGSAQCETSIVCATSWDVDDDPVVFAWEAPSLYALIIEPAELVGYSAGHAVWEQCAAVVGEDIEVHTVIVSVFDTDDEGTPMEEHSGVASEDLAELILTVSFEEEQACWDDDAEELVVFGDPIERVEGCVSADAEAYYCSGEYDDLHPSGAKYDKFCKKGRLKESKAYPECDDDDDDDDHGHHDDD